MRRGARRGRGGGAGDAVRAGISAIGDVIRAIGSSEDSGDVVSTGGTGDVEAAVAVSVGGTDVCFCDCLSKSSFVTTGETGNGIAAGSVMDLVSSSGFECVMPEAEL